jgi:uncharacterized protein
MSDHGRVGKGVTRRFTRFAHQKYLNLETRRKTGKPVTTPVWFAEENGTPYIHSLANTGKVKRIRNNPKVRIVPCDVRGNPTGEWVDAKARILDERGAALGHTLLNQKYGWMKRIGNAFGQLRQRQRVVIAINPVRNVLQRKSLLPGGALQIVARERLIAAFFAAA